MAGTETLCVTCVVHRELTFVPARRAGVVIDDRPACATVQLHQYMVHRLAEAIHFQPRAFTVLHARRDFRQATNTVNLQVSNPVSQSHDAPQPERLTPRFMYGKTALRFTKILPHFLERRVYRHLVKNPI